jgi:hypothetical protein
MGNALDQIAKRGQLARGMRSLLTTAYPERKGEIESAGLEQLQGMLKGEALLAAKREQKGQARQMEQQSQLLELQIGQQQRGRDQEQALMEALAGQMNGAEALRGVGPYGPEAGLPGMDEGGGGRGLPAPAPADGNQEAQRLLRALLMSGLALNPQTPGLLNAVSKMGSRPNEFSVKDLGIPRPVPGQPGEVFVPTSTASGQILTYGGKAMTPVQRSQIELNQARAADLDRKGKSALAGGKLNLIPLYDPRTGEELPWGLVPGTETLIDRRSGMEKQTGRKPTFGGRGAQEAPVAPPKSMAEQFEAWRNRKSKP